MQESKILVLPRNSIKPSGDPVEAPSEEAFTSTFGKLLPPATFIDSKIGRYAYYDLGNAENAGSTQPNRVLLIHGVQTPAIGMLPLARELKALFPSTHFVLLDLWGHGLSQMPFAAHKPELFHFQISHLLDHLGWDSVYLIGYSFGGMLTASFVGANAKRVESFVLVAPAGLLRMSAWSEEEQKLLGPGCEDEVAAQKAVISILEGGELIVPDDWKERVENGEIVAQAVKEWQMREHKGHAASVTAIFRDGGVMDNDVVFEEAAKTNVPNIVVLGELDGVCNKEELVKLGFADVFVVPEVGHGVVRERERDVAQHIANFWRK